MVHQNKERQEDSCLKTCLKQEQQQVPFVLEERQSVTAERHTGWLLSAFSHKKDSNNPQPLMSEE